MPFELSTIDADITSVTARTEKHGEEDVPAISLGFKITTANTILDALSPTLRTTLYTRPEGQEDLPGVESTTPLLRTKGIDEVKLAGTLEGWTLTVDHGIDDSSAIVLGSCKVDKFRCVPKEGGTVELLFRVGTSDASPEDAGLLWAKNGQGVQISLDAPTAKPDAIDGSTAAFHADHPDLLAGPGDTDTDTDSEGGETDATDAFVAEHGA